MYDVLYIERGRRETLVAEGLSREAACELARVEARGRNVGRMFLAGSEKPEVGSVIVIVEASRRAA
jgi:hypothetical protein